MKDVKILSIVPAQHGWFSMYRRENGYCFAAVAVWAIVEDEDGQRVTGYSECEDFNIDEESLANFSGWVYRPDYKTSEQLEEDEGLSLANLRASTTSKE